VTRSNARLVLVRHGQSLWNAENRFTGSTDVPLTEAGREEARRCAGLLRGEDFDVAYTSTLCRAYDSLSIILAELGQTPPVIRDPALNEPLAATSTEAGVCLSWLTAIRSE
jgi:2,3-bisphosphoglycerate-dependent phosphoglycerate mutase